MTPATLDDQGHTSSHQEEIMGLQQGKEIEQGQRLGTLRRTAEEDTREPESRSLGLR